MNPFALVFALATIQTPEPPPPDPLDGVLFNFAITRDEAWHRWRHAKAWRDHLNTHHWRYREEDLVAAREQINLQYRIYDALTDVLSTASFDCRVMGVSKLRDAIGPDAFAAGRLPPLLPPIPD